MFRQWSVQFCSQIRLASKNLKVVQKASAAVCRCFYFQLESGKGIILISKNNSKPIDVRKQLVVVYQDSSRCSLFSEPRSSSDSLC